MTNGMGLADSTNAGNSKEIVVENSGLAHDDKNNSNFRSTRVWITLKIDLTIHILHT